MVSLLFLLLLPLLLCRVSAFNLENSTTATAVGLHCRVAERDALLLFRSKLYDPNSRLPPWPKDQYCCLWEGVRCNMRTGRVAALDLPNTYFYENGYPETNRSLGGVLTQSLVALERLAYLDLSGNDLYWNSIPSFLGSFRRLRYLNLSLAGFNGRVPPELRNLSRMTHLDLSYVYGLEVDDVRWISGLSSLQHLDLSGVKFTNSAPSSWIQSLSMLSSIREVKLYDCLLTSMIIPLSHGGVQDHVNFTSLTRLDLSYNIFTSDIPSWLLHVTSLEHLNLSFNAFSGTIPSGVGNLTSLKYLDLSENNLSGSIPVSIGKLSNLTYLDLNSNNLSGSIPMSIGKLSNLTYLYLHSNNLSGTVPVSTGRLSNLSVLFLSGNSLGGVLTEAHFASLTNLKTLSISSNPSFALKVRPHWNPPFRLETIAIGGCKLGPQFPAWLRTQENYININMSHANISDLVPEWFWNLSTHVNILDLSYNNISGPLQFVASNLTSLINLSNNLFSGTIPASIADVASSLEYLSLSANNLIGTIPDSICKCTKVELIDLSQNHLTGKIPGCWDSVSSLQVLDLSNNNLSGQIPISMCSTGSSLTFFSISNNSISGNIPSSLSNCENMIIFDAADNMLSGTIPAWAETSFSILNILVLRSNMLSGSVPSQLSQLPSLRILNLSKNNLSGSIPNTFGNLTGMKSYLPDFYEVIVDSITYDGIKEQMYSKGRELMYSLSILPFVVNLDISDNNLSGNIPSELGNLLGLRSLSLSGNHLTGHIPKEIGKLKFLESLDLSRNELSGEISSTLAELTFLAWLDLSYNNLSGKIPYGNQLQTLDGRSYIGNPYLCGFPLAKACQDNKTIHQAQITIEDEGSEILWLYAGFAPGFTVTIFIIWVVLMLHRSLRITYFKFIDYTCETIYVMLLLGKEMLKRKFLPQN